MQAKAVKKSIYLIRAAAVALVSVLLFSCLLIPGDAWFDVEKKGGGDVEYGNMKVETEIYFLHNGTEIDPDSNADYKNRDGSVRVLVQRGDTAKVNYISNVRVRIRYRGLGLSYLRVIFADQWTQEITEHAQYITRKVFPDYGFESEHWVDNRKNDLCYYFRDSSGDVTEELDPYAIYQEKADYDLDKWIELELFETETASNLMANVAPLQNEYVWLKVTAEAVQANRAGALWGIDKMPD